MLSIRIIVGGFFAWEAADKIRRFGEWVDFVAEAGMPAPTVQIAFIVFLLVVGTTLVALGRHARIGAAMLLLYLLPTMLLFMEPQTVAQMVPFGVGLVLIAVKGPGPSVWPKPVAEGSADAR